MTIAVRRGNVGVHGASKLLRRSRSMRIQFSVAIPAEYCSTNVFLFPHSIVILALSTPTTDHLGC